MKIGARLAQSVEHKALNLVVGSSPMVGVSKRHFLLKHLSNIRKMPLSQTPPSAIGAFLSDHLVTFSAFEAFICNPKCELQMPQMLHYECVHSTNLPKQIWVWLDLNLS